VEIQPHGHVYLHGIRIQISNIGPGKPSTRDESGVVFADTNGEVLIERAWPAKGQTYVSNGIRRGPAKLVIASPGYPTNDRVHRHSQTTPTSGSS
jgi:hypothetical protein